jgi:hypothetical protein
MKCLIGSPPRERRVLQMTEVLLLADCKAQVRARALTVDALAALRREERHDMVAQCEIAHTLAERLDDACALVAEHGRRVAGGVDTGRRVQIGVTDTAGDEPDEHLAGLRVGELELLHDERLPELLEQRGTHLHLRLLLACLMAPMSRRAA